MIRLVPLIVAGMQFVGSLAAWAQSTAPEGDYARYTFNRVNDGYLRLDGRTGQVSVCTQRPAGSEAPRLWRRTRRPGFSASPVLESVRA